MRLSDILSKEQDLTFKPLDSFLVGKKGRVGQKVELDIGTIALNYYCKKCENMRTFNSKGRLSCIFINKNMVSIDCVLSCTCGSTVGVWFIVESENDITSFNPKVRILKRSERLSESVQMNGAQYGIFNDMLNNAERAYRENLGAGAVVYLRKIFEMITIQTANSKKIEYMQYEGGNPKNFSGLLEKVDEKCSIIPKEFSENGKQLFKELSTILHGDVAEEIGIQKYKPLHRLVIGILDNVRNRSEFNDAKKALGWTIEEEV